jgi:predicted ester cyclase
MFPEALHRAIAERWLAAFWGQQCDLAIVDELAADEVVLQYSMAGPLRGRTALKGFMSAFREAFPDMRFERYGQLLADGNVVVYRWHCCGTHTGPAYHDFNIGPLKTASGRKIELSGHAAIKLAGELIIEEAIWSTQRQAQMRVIPGGLMM